MNNNTKNPLYDPSTDNQKIDDTVQSMINAPLKDESGLSEEDKHFLELIMKLIEDGSIKLHEPSSLLNNAVYGALDEMAKGKADQNTVTMLARIRDIHDLMQLSTEPTFQVQNLVKDLRYKKERLEDLGGDLFII